MSTAFLLPVWDTLQEAWAKVKGAKGSIWGAIAIVLLITLCLNFVIGVLHSISPKVEGIATIFIQLFNYLLSMGLMYIGIRRAFDMPITFKDLFGVFEDNKWLKLIGLYILQTIIFILTLIPAVIAAGIAVSNQIVAMRPEVVQNAARDAMTVDTSNTALVALVAALVILSVLLMIYVSVRLWAAPGFILDRGYGPFRAIGSSFSATRSNFWRLLGYGLLQMLIFIGGVLLLLVLTIWTVPLLVIAYGMMYKKLVINADTSSLPAESTPILVTPTPEG